MKFGKRLVYESVGFTGGWGEFHFSDGVYEDLSDFARKRCVPTAKQEKWGSGFRNRRELVRKALIKLGFTQEMLNHGIQREVFVAPLASNAREFLGGGHPRPRYRRLTFARAAEFWRKRWLLPRAERDASFREFTKTRWPKLFDN